MKEPIKVCWSDHDYCYYSRCPNCNELITFHNAWQPNEFDEEVKCERCNIILDIRRWLNK